MINLPHSLTRSLHESLLADVEWARNNATGEGGKERDLYKFTHVLVVTRLESSTDQESDYSQDSKGRYTTLPPLRRIIDEYVLKFSAIAPFEHKVKLPGGEGSAKYLVGAVKFKDFERAVEEFGREI